MTLTFAQLAQFSLGAVLIILLPGPNSLFVATSAAQVSRRAGWQAAAGVFISDSILMIAAVAGAGTLLTGGSLFFRALTLVGGAYLAYLGFGLLRRGVQLLREHRALTRAEATDDSLNPIDTGAAPDDAGTATSPFRRSIATGMLNPKSILFFAAFFVQFVTPGDPHLWVNFGVLAVIMQIISLTYLAAVIAISSRLGHRVAGRPRVVAGAHLAAGTAFCLFAVKLATASF